MPVTKIMDVKINYEDEGEGYPILFIHGFTRCLQDWHVVNLERPDDFNREMISFLNEVTG